MKLIECRVVLTGLLPATLLALGDMPPAAAGDPLLVPFALAGVSEAGGFAPAVARVVQSLVEYTRWPNPPNPVRLCVVGPALYAARLGGMRLADGRAIDRLTLPALAVKPGGCDAVLIGQLPFPAQRQLINRLRGRGILTIAEADPQCRSQAMFCLHFTPEAVSFRLNIDAVTRSGLRVDPRVLRLSAGAP